jgi:hypothetical protein
LVQQESDQPAMAVPDGSLLPVAKLNKSVMHVLRNDKDSCVHYEYMAGQS